MVGVGVRVTIRVNNTVHKEVLNCWVIKLSPRLSGLMARCWFYYVLV